MFNTLPPVGTPIRWASIFATEKSPGSAFENDLRLLFSGNIFLTCSGRSALYLILKAACEIYPDKNEVIIPNYTCWSIPSAIVKSGLVTSLVDNDICNLGISLDSVIRAINKKTLAVVASHLFGIPGAIDELERICQDRGVVLIDDAAQALGASFNNRPLGSFGDAGILSFGRGKSITTNSGGAALIRNSDLKTAASTIYRTEFGNPGQNKSIDVFQLAAYKLLFSRYLYWIPDSIPFLNIGATINDPNFSLQGYSQYRKVLGSSLLKYLNTINNDRNKIASRYQELLREFKSIKIPCLSDLAKPAYLRYPIIVDNPEKKLMILKYGHSLGISGMYPDTISSIPDLKATLSHNGSICTNSEYISRGLVTLPTHYTVKEKDILGIVQLSIDIGCK